MAVDEEKKQPKFCGKKTIEFEIEQKNYDKIEFKVYGLADSSCALYFERCFAFGTTLLSLQVRKYIYHQIDMAGECTSQ